MFYAETLLNARIDDLTDIEEITGHIVALRKIEGRSVKFNGKPEKRDRVLTATHFQPSCPILGTPNPALASND